MTQASPRLREYLEKQGVGYQVLAHRRDFRAQCTAQHTHTSGWEFAKTVVIWADGRFLMVVLPAIEQLDLAVVAREVGTSVVRLATEDELFELFPDCEVGSEPPFGNLYDLPVYITPSLRSATTITFNAGSHEEAIRIARRDFERVVGPRRIETWH